VIIGPDEIDETTVPVPAAHVALIDVDDGAVLIDEEAGRGYPLNATASLLWKLLDSVSPVGDLIDDVSAAFDVPRSAVADSVHDLVRTFGHLGLFENMSRNFNSVPIDIRYADPDMCPDPVPPEGAGERSLDDRYLAVPANA
jgi:Coenzyme PQQ synthesis protein D (PqqD)